MTIGISIKNINETAASCAQSVSCRSVMIAFNQNKINKYYPRNNSLLGELSRHEEIQFKSTVWSMSFKLNKNK